MTLPVHAETGTEMINRWLHATAAAENPPADVDPRAANYIIILPGRSTYMLLLLYFSGAI